MWYLPVKCYRVFILPIFFSDLLSLFGCLSVSFSICIGTVCNYIESHLKPESNTLYVYTHLAKKAHSDFRAGWMHITLL